VLKNECIARAARPYYTGVTKDHTGTKYDQIQYRYTGLLG